MGQGRSLPPNVALVLHDVYDTIMAPTLPCVHTSEKSDILPGHFTTADIPTAQLVWSGTRSTPLIHTHRVHLDHCSVGME